MKYLWILQIIKVQSHSCYNTLCIMYRIVVTSLFLLTSQGNASEAVNAHRFQADSKTAPNHSKLQLHHMLLTFPRFDWKAHA